MPVGAIPNRIKAPVANDKPNRVIKKATKKSNHTTLAAVNMLPIRQAAADLFRKTCLKLLKKASLPTVSLCLFEDDGTPKKAATKAISETGNANHKRYERQLPTSAKNRLITRVPAMLAKDGPVIIHPVAFGLFFKANISPTNVIVITITTVVPIPSMAKKTCRKMKFGAKEQPKAPNGMHEAPRTSSFLWLNLTLRTPNSTAKIAETKLATVASWLVIATKTGSVEPKKVAVTPSKNTPAIRSTMKSEKLASVKEGTNSLPAEDSSLESGSNVFIPSYPAEIA